ncbi:MAG: hypothetical protein CM1200mP40_10370 [Gammaproteobacteria bacterium]|nr:MAG: hypothetical protein CM1200mP40_10370 [Gammaproteobacteria bacterium]
MEVGGAPYLASLRMDQAKTWEEFRVASNYSNIPGENMIWADRDGNIGWQAVGIAPIREILAVWSGIRRWSIRMGWLSSNYCQAT